jgi:hypothetical protein
MKMRNTKNGRVYDVSALSLLIALLTGRAKLGKGAFKRKPIVGGKKPSRNKPCLCGSGSKYKFCCGSPERRDMRAANRAREAGEHEWDL